MERIQLIETLRATLDPGQRKQAEEHLGKIHGVIGFLPSLLQVVMMADVEKPVRQAAAVFLKNLIQFNWVEKKAEADLPARQAGVRPIKLKGQKETELLFSKRGSSVALLKTTIPERDRAIIRDTIVDAVVFAPELKAQLSICVDILVQQDFPGRWIQIVDKISAYMQNPEPSGWTGALLCLYRLLKNLTKNMTVEERAPYYDTMIQLHPVTDQLMVTLLPDQSEQSALLQKQILKIYFAITRFRLPLDMISQEVFSHWMEVVCSVVERPVPDETNLIDESEQADLPWWKCKKWALRALLNVFKKYGNTGSVNEDYKQFSMWYLSKYSRGILEVLLRILYQYRIQYVSQIVLQDILNYLIVGVSHTHSMEFLRPHMFSIIRDVLLPIISHTDEGDEFWSSDLQDFIWNQFSEGVDQGFVSLVGTARSLLDSVCKNDNKTLQETVQLILQVLSSPNADVKQKVGVLHMLAILAEILLIDQMYNDHIESIIQQFILPELRIPHRHSHVSAYRVLRGFSKIKYKEEHILDEAMHLIVNDFMTNGEQFVKVEAAFTLQIMLRDQEHSHKYVESQVRSVMLELLSIMKIANITPVLDMLVTTFTDQIKTLAVEMCHILAQTLGQIFCSDDSSLKKDTTAKGLVEAVEMLLNVTEDQPEIHEQLQPLALDVIDRVFSNSTQEMQQTMFGVLNLVYELTCKAISPKMWTAFEQMIQIVEKDSDYFTNMMYPLHNYITLDTEAFLANPRYVEAIYNVVKAVLTGDDAGEVTEGEAAKLLEVIILQCIGRIDWCIEPFVELAFQRLLREEQDTELRTVCLLVVVSAVYYNPQLLFSIIDTISLPIPQSQSASAIFIKLLLEDTNSFHGLHDRKISMLGICTMISFNPRPRTVEECAPQFIPSLIILFDSLKRAYRIKASERDEEEVDDKIEDEVLSCDEINNEYSKDEEMKNDSVESIENKESDDDSDDGSLHEYFEPLERYTTPLDEENCSIDEFIIFKKVLEGIEWTDKAWYNALTAHLSAEQRKSLDRIMMTADRRKADAERRKVQSIKATGDQAGYVFVLHAPPTSFNFGGIPLGQ